MRGLAVAGAGGAVVVSTDRGLYTAAGESWTLLVENLPAHLEAWPLVRDPVDRATLYAGFALVPYLELWRLAAEQQTPLDRIGPAGLVGGAAFFLLLGLAATAVLRALARRDRAHSPARTEEPDAQRIPPGRRTWTDQVRRGRPSDRQGFRDQPGPCSPTAAPLRARPRRRPGRGRRGRLLALRRLGGPRVRRVPDA